MITPTTSWLFQHVNTYVIFFKIFEKSQILLSQIRNKKLEDGKFQNLKNILTWTNHKRIWDIQFYCSYSFKLEILNSIPICIHNYFLTLFCRYKPVTVKPSDKPLTDAHSPCFSQRTRRHNISDVWQTKIFSILNYLKWTFFQLTLKN